MKVEIPRNCFEGDLKKKKKALKWGLAKSRQNYNNIPDNFLIEKWEPLISVRETRKVTLGKKYDCPDIKKKKKKDMSTPSHHDSTKYCSLKGVFPLSGFALLCTLSGTRYSMALMRSIFFIFMYFTSLIRYYIFLMCRLFSFYFFLIP